MKKVKRILKNNIKVVIAFILGIILTGGLAYADILYQGTNVGYDNSSSGLSATTVQGALDELYNVTRPSTTCSLASQLTVGKYFTMKPSIDTYTISTSLTGHTSNQTVSVGNSNGLTLWRVIQRGPCSVDAVSEYVTYEHVHFTGATGYANFVGGLNEIARAFQNPKYTSGARAMGYGGQTEYIVNTTGFDGSRTTAPGTSTTATPTTGLGQEFSGISPGDLGDTLYLKDIQLVGNVYKSDTSTYGSTGLKAYLPSGSAGNYWLASRLFAYNSSTYFGFNTRHVHADSGAIGNPNIRLYYNGWSNNTSSNSNHVRPIITLKSGVTVKSGSGTKTSPYILN